VEPELLCDAHAWLPCKLACCVAGILCLLALCCSTAKLDAEMPQARGVECRIYKWRALPAAVLPSRLVTCPMATPAGWRYDGTLCNGHGDTGLVWECPLLVRLNTYKPAPAALPVHTLGLDRGAGPLSPSVSLRAMALLDAHSSLPDGGRSSSNSPDADERCAAGWVAMAAAVCQGRHPLPACMHACMP
jgi:hypothetical protein